MSDKKNDKNQNFDTDIRERPLDPSRNSSDLMGDPSGMTGWTVGSGADTSAEPTERQPDTENLPGSIQENATSHQPTGIPKESISDKVYNHNIWSNMSQTQGRESDDIAEEAESFTSVSDMIRDEESKEEGDSYNPDKLREESVGESGPIINTESAPYVHPENVGEQEISGSATDPNADDDMLANVQAVGGQLDEDADHPKELDTGVDEAEEYIKHH